jgi:hypothetical protein
LVEETGVPGENHWPVTSHWHYKMVKLINWFFTGNGRMKVKLESMKFN